MVYLKEIVSSLASFAPSFLQTYPNALFFAFYITAASKYCNKPLLNSHFLACIKPFNRLLEAMSKPSE